ncbi:MAG: gamma-glutamylcyclotransferase [Bryobacteraceae bacterium]|nr:gamma-glutamylcyclotransferase [Bryobacteraceae bacterium]
MTELLFVYGTLRRGAYRGGQVNPFAVRLEQEARWLGPAKAPGRLYQVNPEYPGMRPPETVDEWVTGEVWEFSDVDLWQALDHYEGAEYVRTLSKTVLHDGSERQAWVYLYASKITTAMAITGV